MKKFETYYKIFDCFFNKIVTNQHGSAICCYAPSISVYGMHCVFIKCESTFEGISSIRTTGNYVSGGACYFDINLIYLGMFSFSQCKSKSLGSCFYICSSQGHQSIVKCFSDSNCGNMNTNSLFSICNFD